MKKNNKEKKLYFRVLDWFAKWLAANHKRPTQPSMTILFDGSPAVMSLSNSPNIVGRTRRWSDTMLAQQNVSPTILVQHPTRSITAALLFYLLSSNSSFEEAVPTRKRSSWLVWAELMLNYSVHCRECLDWPKLFFVDAHFRHSLLC
jgi:hypothetical protein